MSLFLLKSIRVPCLSEPKGLISQTLVCERPIIDFFFNVNAKSDKMSHGSRVFNHFKQCKIKDLQSFRGLTSLGGLQHPQLFRNDIQPLSVLPVAQNVAELTFCLQRVSKPALVSAKGLQIGTSCSCKG